GMGIGRHDHVAIGDDLGLFVAWDRALGRGVVGRRRVLGEGAGRRGEDQGGREPGAKAAPVHLTRPFQSKAPSRPMNWPVIDFALSLARNRMVSAISSGST